MFDSTKSLFVGLDVHKNTIVIAVAEANRSPARAIATVPFEWKALTHVLEKLGPKEAVSCCYEAGPTGYGLARSLRAAGWACDVIAPSLVPKKSGERIKTDRRDAAKLAVNHRNGELVAVTIPDEACEAIRDLERARGAAKKAERVARHQLSKFLLRHGRNYPGKTTWNDAHRAWIAGQKFAEPAQAHVLADALATVETATLRVSQLTARLRELAETWDRAPLVKALQAMRGVEFVTAVTVAAEVGDFRRFKSAGDFMGYVGLIPSEQTTGQTRRLGPITKTGNAHVRRLLVESAWHYRRQPRMSKAIRERSVGIAPGVCAIAWKAQKRLHNRLNKLLGRSKHPAEAVTAVARELAGFIWAIGREEVLLAATAN
jgi:transposase